MKRLIPYKIFEIANPYTGIVKDDWNKAIIKADKLKIKELLDNGYDINSKDKNGNTILHILAYFMTPYYVRTEPEDYIKVKELMEYVLVRPDVDFSINNGEVDFIYYFEDNVRFLTAYPLQKKIAENNEKNILFLYNHDLINEDIKKEYKHLFVGKDLNLL
jgi:hypothetical protein